MYGMTEQSPITHTIRIAVAQLNPTVGDVSGNLAKAREARAEAAREGAQILMLSCSFPAIRRRIWY